MHQRDLWKDRFFFRALEADEDDLCGECRESMRQAFYVKGDKEEALKWRPCKVGCDWRNCKYAMDTYEEDCDNEYGQECKNTEYVAYFSDSDSSFSPSFCLANQSRFFVRTNQAQRFLYI